MLFVALGPGLWGLFVLELPLGLGVAAGGLEFWLPVGLVVPPWFSVLVPGGFELVAGVLWLAVPGESVPPAGFVLLLGEWGLWSGLLAEPFWGALVPVGLETWVASLPLGAFGLVAEWEPFAGSWLPVELGPGEVALSAECEVPGEPFAEPELPVELGLPVDCEPLGELAAESGLLVEVELPVVLGPGEVLSPVGWELLGEVELCVEGGLPVEVLSLVECEPFAELATPEGLGPLDEFWPLAELGPAVELGPPVEGELPVEAPPVVEFGPPAEVGLPVELFGGVWLLAVGLLAGG
ncbi:hypothetical protein [Amycolatopsis sp. NPDC004079]|uniref:hypothetical protein n=1 Tax=Amycolatopsis sp. NPDC004079 TaxID=3154549 RepID=UPI0033B80F8E